MKACKNNTQTTKKQTNKKAGNLSFFCFHAENLVAN
jgi:hypothetical protein